MVPEKKQTKAQASPKTHQGYVTEQLEQAASVRARNEQEPLLFYMPDAEFGEFCQWCPSMFTVLNKEISDLAGHTIGEPTDEIAFNCAEQFMMYCKAARFHDRDRQARILQSPSPKEQKQLGN